ncbi:hypothetical protein KIH41_05725 [Litoribacter ruber]|uniref:Uncharacterized protein n=1 Tax=Litoribacter ruber TaxID=702568 RepID=A0AAP2CFY2_9BACT|nr:MULTISPECIES: hypothetical protein [Litoribacter]MBS9523060.1 hypothetical protein [Litoribacter alkaliphilus]MBT0810776.1 hypothetical protein [Litoribacter ruber]
MRNIIPFLIIWCCLFGGLLFACSDEFDNQLQTDPEFEAEEIFNASAALDEHLYFLTMGFEDFQMASSDSLQLPGCPIINVEENDRKVTLIFTNQECPDGTTRRGGFEISFAEDSLPTMLTYQNYQVRQNTIEGSRSYLRDSSLITENSEDILVFDSFGSSTRLNLIFHHELIYLTDTLSQIATRGEATGRNLAGRPFNMQVAEEKIQTLECWSQGINLASVGRENWNIERQQGLTVRHQISYGNQDDCDEQAEVTLDNGQRIILTTAN